MTDPVSARKQLPLNIGYKEKPGFDLYFPGENSQVVESVKRIASGAENRCIYLWGQSGLGKSHLLHAACMLADEHRRGVAYVPLSNHADLDPQLLQDMDNLDLVCIDDIDCIKGELEWQQSILHLYNRIRDKRVQEKQGSMLITGAVSPQALAIELQDLRSRIGWDLTFHLKPLTDHDKVIILKQRAHLRAFDLPNEVAEYLVKRVKRDLPGLIALLDQFDDATLVAQKKLTIPFVKQLIKG